MSLHPLSAGRPPGPRLQPCLPSQQQPRPPARRCRTAAAVSGGGNADGSNGSSAPASGNGSNSSGAASSSQQRPLAPWVMTFDLRERDTLWTPENQARLVRIVAGYQLRLDVEEVERRLGELAVLLPQVAARCAYIKPSTLAELLRDSGALMARLLTLRQLLPRANIGALAAAEPELLLLRDLEALKADLARLRELLGAGTDIEAVVQQQPRFLDAELVSEVLEELARLMPGQDPVATLLNDPSFLLRVERGRSRLGPDPD